MFSGDSSSEDKVARGDGFGLKRKQCLEDVIPLKRIKMARTNSGTYGFLILSSSSGHLISVCFFLLRLDFFLSSSVKHCFQTFLSVF